MRRALRPVDCFLQIGLASKLRVKDILAGEEDRVVAKLGQLCSITLI